MIINQHHWVKMGKDTNSLFVQPMASFATVLYKKKNDMIINNFPLKSNPNRI